MVETRGANRKLAKAIGALPKFERMLRSRRAKALPSAVRDSYDDQTYRPKVRDILGKPMFLY